jgi:hypothetical protein
LRELAACDDERERLRVERLRVVRQKDDSGKVDASHVAAVTRP